ncbi:MAG: hypothetical protein JXR97_01990 [Planctomycetes bacterium]|nr:hypothetical protein [Planctomycetota bacterium]
MKHVLSIAFLVIACCCTTAFGEELVDGVEVNETGKITVENVSMALLHMDGDWGPSRQMDAWSIKAADGYPKSTKGKWEFKGDFSLKQGGKAVIEEQLVIKSKRKLQLSMKFTSEQPVSTKVLAYVVNLPVDEYAGKTVLIGDEEVTLPQECKGQQVKQAADVKSISIPLEKKKLNLNGKFHVYIQDERQYNGNCFTVRLSFNPSSGEIKKSDFSMTLEFDK